MVHGHVLQRWFHEPHNILEALEAAYELDRIDTTDSSRNEQRPTDAAFLRNEQLWRVHTRTGPDLTETTKIDVFVLDPSVTFDRPAERIAWENDLGVAFHDELLDLLGAAAVPVSCADCDYSFVAIDHDEAEAAKTIHQNNDENDEHSVTIGTGT